MFIYTLYYEDTKMHNRTVFAMPNDETAIKAMKLNLLEKDAERFRNEVKEGNVYLIRLIKFSEEEGIIEDGYSNEKVINLKDLINEPDGTLEDTK